jgi:hypothetical protein
MEIRKKENGGIMAFGLVQLGLTATSLRDRAMAYEVLEWLSSNYWNPNLVSTHDPKKVFNTDICGGFPAVVSRMLLDSGEGWVELLPALPEAWPNGAVEGLRARGRIAVDRLEWSPRALACTLRSEVAQPVELRLPGGLPARSVTLPAGRPVKVEIPRAAQPSGQ